MTQENKQDPGLARRGLILLVLVGGIVAVVLTILFKRPAQTLPTESKQPEPFIAGLATPGLAFPASLSWPALAKLGETLPSAPGWEVRYNAAASLGRIGSGKTPWPVLAEMLDEQQQMRNFRVKLDSGKVVPDEAAARLTVISALKAVKQWHEKQTATITPAAEMAAVYDAVERLVSSPIVEVKKQAEEARTAIHAKMAG